MGEAIPIATIAIDAVRRGWWIQRSSYARDGGFREEVVFEEEEELLFEEEELLFEEASEVVVFEEEELLFEEASEVMVFREASDVKGRGVLRGANTHPHVTHVTRYGDSPVD